MCVLTRRWPILYEVELSMLAVKKVPNGDGEKNEEADTANNRSNYDLGNCVVFKFSILKDEEKL